VNTLDLAGPVILFFMMALVGAELTPDDFRRIARYPRAVVIGTLAQWTLLPLAAAVLIWLFTPPDFVAAGMVLIVAAPGGGISNVFTYLAGGNVALSVTLTAVASLGAAVMLPLITALGFERLVGETTAVSVPVAPMIGQLAGLVLLPIGLGMLLRSRRPDVPERAGPWMRRLVLISVVLLFAAGMGDDDSGLAGEVLAAAPLGLAWSVAAMGIGWATALALRLDGPERFTFLIEFSVKNVALAAIVALTGFDRPEFAVFSGAYAMTGYPLAILAALAFKRMSAPPSTAPRAPR
jgi:BASS family bile acid:Na+ symporter